MPRFKRKPAQGTAGAELGLPTGDDLFDQCGRVFASGIRQGLVADDEGGCAGYLLNLTWPRRQPRPVAGLADTYVMTICEEPVRGPSACSRRTWCTPAAGRSSTRPNPSGSTARSPPLTPG